MYIHEHTHGHTLTHADTHTQVASWFEKKKTWRHIGLSIDDRVKKNLLTYITMLGFGEHGSANDRAASSSLDQSKRLAAHPPPSLPELGACKCWHRDIIRDKSGRATDRETETAEGDGE